MIGRQQDNATAEPLQFATGITVGVADVVVLGWCTPAASDRRAQEIAAFTGAKASLILLDAAALLGGAELAKLLPRCACLIVAAETLAQAVDVIAIGICGLLSLMAGATDRIFIYGFKPTERHSTVLRALSAGALSGVQSLNGSAAKFQVEEQWEGGGPFSGLSFGMVDGRRDNCFVEETTDQRSAVLIRAGGQPFLARTEQDGLELFFLACGELADLDERVQGEASLLPWFSQLAPLMMFLRGVLGKRTWQNDRPQACFIIDDPLLRKRHGFLEYQRLVENIRRLEFTTCIAFIPWNYRRSSPEVATLFSSPRSSKTGELDLCIHGCDHSRAEFATTDFDSLRGKAQLALDRMRAHERLYDVPFDEIMVFPQGLFSAEAMTALRAAGYLAAINSDLCPSTQPGTLTLRDLLQVAVTRLADFPLFGRRYPRDVAEFAFDLFLGKPALAVEHHGYFRNGYQPLEAFVKALNRLDERLEWTTLRNICSQACLTRVADDGDVHVRFYTPRFVLTNRGRRSQRYVLFSRYASSGTKPCVTRDDKSWGCEQQDGQLKIRLSLEPGQTAEIRVLPAAGDRIGSPWKGTAIHHARIRIRRLLCEFRDNHVDRSRILTAIVSAARSFGRAFKPQTALPL